MDVRKDQEAFKQVDDAEILWKACADVLRDQVSEAVWLTSFNAVEPVSLVEGVLVLAVPSSVVRERIEARYLAVVKGALADAGQPDIELEFLVRTDEDTSPDVEPLTWGRDPDDGDRLVGVTADLERHRLEARVDARLDPRDPRLDPRLDALAPNGRARADDGLPGGADRPGGRSDSAPANPRYTFESFITGTSNRFAHAAALAVAETPARSYNPLFIYGGAGLGKTHLLQAISHYIGEHYPSFVVRYVSTEHFLNQYVEAIRTGEMADFKKRYREVDVLLLDDIQFIEGKEGLQEELFHTFNTLHQSNRQIVLSSDRPPDAISTLEDRLRSRFRMGLITEINPPDLETRLAILRTKAENERTPMPADVLEYIASGITNNIRELEGALIRVSAYASLTSETLSLELAERVLADLLSDSQPRPITPALILEKTSEMFGFPIEEIQGKSRRRPLVTARQISMYVFRELTDLSYPAIAREFGGRDHTTVIHAVEKIGALMKERRQIYDQVTELTQSIRNG